MDTRALPRVLVKDREAPESPARAERVGHEVHTPAFVRSRQRLAHDSSNLTTLPLLSPAYGQAFFSVDPLHPFAVHQPSLATQQRVDHPVAPPRVFSGELVNANPQRFLGRTYALVPDRRPRKTCEANRSTLGDILRDLNLLDDTPPLTCRHNLFPSRSFNTCRFKAWSATIRFNRRFSSSRPFRRLASLTSSPPYLRFHRYSVFSLIPCRRHTSRPDAPASTSAKIPMICSSLNRLLRMSPPFASSPIILGSGSGGHLNFDNITASLLDPFGGTINLSIGTSEWRPSLPGGLFSFGQSSPFGLAIQARARGKLVDTNASNPDSDEANFVALALGTFSAKLLLPIWADKATRDPGDRAGSIQGELTASVQRSNDEDYRNIFAADELLDTELFYVNANLSIIVTNNFYASAGITLNASDDRFERKIITSFKVLR